ncbi:UNVERIFIED_CONTAM: hypothetical protein Sangu_1019700 [Sesamum angustifolium]|uniref:Uncharacterized protein n=1 Tax=Sesamum angustifolium TaxID=2727405 RepID=A0AAW2NZ56_9LAMI
MEMFEGRYSSTLATRLRTLTLRFNQYVLDLKRSMIQHLNVMKVIRELQNSSCDLNDEQQVFSVLRSLPEQTWGYVKLVLTHNEQIKKFDSVDSHLKLEAERNLNVLNRMPLSHMPVSVSPLKASVGTNRLVQDQVIAKAKSRTWPHKVIRL